MLTQLVRRGIVICFHLLLIVVPLTWTAQTSELFEFPKMLMVYAFASIVLVLWLARSVIDKKLTFNPTFLFIPLCLFLASQIISTIFSLDPHTSFFGYYSRFHGGLLSTISYLILYFAFASNVKPSDLKALLLSFFVAGTLGALYAFPEHWGASPSCYLITGKFDATCWVQDVTTRVYGTFGQPNWLAAYLITIIFIPVALIVSQFVSKNKKPNHLIVAGNITLSALFLSVLFFTKSRSGLAGLGLGIVVFSILTIVASKNTVKKLVVPFSLLAIIVLFITLLFGKGIFNRLDSLVFNRLNNTSTPTQQAITSSQPEPTTPPPSGTQLEVGGTESGQIRSIVWRGALEIFKKYPLFGSGVETFAYAYYPSRPVEHNLVSEWDFLYNKAHNEFLNFLSTTGIVGLGSYLAIMGTYTVWTLKKVIPPSRQHNSKTNTSLFSPSLTALILIALLSGYVSLAVSNFFGFSTVPVAVLFFLFPAAAVLLTSPNLSTDDQPSFSITLNNAQYLLITVLAAGLIFLLLRTYNLYSADKAYALGKANVSALDLQKGIPLLVSAVQKFPSESLYYDELSYSLSKAALAIAGAGEATQAAQVAQQAVAYSNKALELNRVHLNYYKTRARLFVNLTAIDPQYAVNATQTLIQAIQLAPTDAKLWYNLGLLLEQLGDTDRAQQMYQKSVSLKPNYEAARMDLARIYEASGSAQLAKEQYDYILQHINPNNSEAASKSAANE